MSKQVQNFIDDARRFQRCSDHDLAISSLQLAQQEDHHKEHEIEIQKLFSLSYRKIGNYNMALLHINNLDRHLCQFFCHFTAEQHTPCFLYFYIHGGLRSGGGNQNTEFFVCYVFQIQHRIHPFLYFGAEILYSNGAFSGSNAATFSGFAKSTLAAMRRV